MHKTNDIPMSRIDARVPLFVRETIDRAAAMLGCNRTDFIISTMMEKSQKVIAEQSMVHLTINDQLAIANALSSNKAMEISPFVKQIIAEYKKK